MKVFGWTSRAKYSRTLLSAGVRRLKIVAMRPITKVPWLGVPVRPFSF